MTPLEFDLATNRLIKLGIVQPDHKDRLTSEFITFYQDEGNKGQIDVEVIDWAKSRHYIVDKAEVGDMLVEKLIRKFTGIDGEEQRMGILVQRAKSLMHDLSDNIEAWDLYEQMGYKHK